MESVLKIASGFALCFVASIQPAIAQNGANAYLLSLAPAGRAAMLGKVVGEGCVGKTTFYMGIGKKPGLGMNKGFWSVRCEDGRPFIVQVNPDGNGSVMECALLKSMGAGECFKKLPE